ncbi:MAG: M56 family metallopeptidase [Lachnospiraceae bacterium]|nr:M56 family metallopeptidase [Lachnospiraceae bacterium]
MNEFIKILLSLSVSGALLLLLILGLKPLYKNKFSKRWQYYIWIVVALRFLLPFTPDTTMIGSLFEKFDTAAITNEIPTNPNVPVPADTGNSKAEPIQTNREVTTATMREPFNKYVCLFFIWSALALVLFVRKVTVYQGFIQYIKAGNKEVSDIKILNLLSDCEEKLNIKTRVELSCNPLIASPMLIGFFRPRIILPVGEWEDKELSYIFVHELIHYKQRDMFYKSLIQIVVCVHWFNPFVYLLEKEVNKSCELSCDEKVISILDDTARREYGDILISFLKSNNLYKSSLASVTLTEGAEQLKERLGAIIKFRKKSKVIIAITAIFTVAVCICFFVTGAYAAPSIANEKKSFMEAAADIFGNDEEKKQFTEIISASGEMIGIIDNNKEIERFIKQLDIESWNYMEQLPENIDLVYSYISYEVIDEPIFLQDGKQLVNMSTLEFYISSKGEYIIRNYNQEVETIARISEKAGRFLNAPEDLELNKNITAKDILDGWGFDFYVPNNDIESDIEKTDDIETARYYEGETSFTEKELLKTSKEQKIQFYGADKNTVLNEIDDISEIAQYLNGLALEQWEYADNAPNPEEVECQIVRFMLSRDNKKELKEMYTEILYKSNGNYYIEVIIPGEYSDRGEFITHYQVSEEIAKYILSYIETASN